MAYDDQLLAQRCFAGGVAPELVATLPERGAVDLPLYAIVQELNRPPRPLPPGTPIVDLFDASNDSLLILGAPGAGKTTLLLELARDLITRAECDATHPIPVVFNLSSWAKKRQPLTAWLVDELNVRYDVPRKIGDAWVRGDMLTLLLDGLDEVQGEYRSACIEAINTYRSEHGFVALTVCSRIVDYKSLAVKLRLQEAVVVQPLTSQQIGVYLAQVGEPLEGLKVVLDQDTALRELAKTPLMLAILILAYGEIPAEQLEVMSSPGQQRQHLFDAYLERMFVRRRASQPYPRKVMMRRLTWLAKQQIEAGQTIFQIEDLQPRWLPTRRAQRSYQILFLSAIRLVFGLAGFLVFGPLFGLAGFLVFGQPFGLAGSAVFERDGLMGGMLGGVLGGVLGGLMGEIGVRDLIGGLDSKEALERVKPVDTFFWSWRKARQEVAGLLGGVLPGGLAGVLSFGLIGFMAIVLAGVLIGGVATLLVAGLAVVLVISLARELLRLLALGLVSRVSQRQRPNEGIHRSLRNAVRSCVMIGLVGFLLFGLGAGLLGGLLGGLGGGLLLALGLGLAFGLAAGLNGGLVGGLVGGFQQGGFAVVQHYILRLLLWRYDVLPLRLVPFLDHCVERIFLRKVGGGYIFVHRMLMEHFASLDSSSPGTASGPRKPSITSASQ